MSAEMFDAAARSIAESRSRRVVLKALVGGALAAPLALLRGGSGAEARHGRCRQRLERCCLNRHRCRCCRGLGCALRAGVRVCV